MLQAAADFRPAGFDIYARPDSPFTLIATIEGGGYLTAPTASVAIGDIEPTPTVTIDTGADTVTVEFSLSTADTTALGLGPTRWLFKLDDTPFLTGAYRGSLAGNTLTSQSVNLSVLSTGAVTVTVLAAGGSGGGGGGSSTDSVPSETYGPMLKLDRDAGEITVLVVSDSTGVGATRWPTVLAGQLAASWPARTVTFRQFDNTSNTYGSPSTIATGSGTHSLHVWNGAVSGWRTRQVGGDRTVVSAVTTGHPDIVYVSLGHNETSDMDAFHDDYVACVERIAATWPGAAICCVLQNPSTLNDNQQARAAVIARYAALRGFATVDVQAAFLAVTDWDTSLMIDDAHPNTTGSTLWATTIADRWSLAKATPLAQSAARFLAEDHELLNVTKLTATGLPSSVAYSGNTISAASRWETQGEALRVTCLNSTPSVVEFTVPDPLRLAGRWVTFAVRVWRPSASLGSNPSYACRLYGEVDGTVIRSGPSAPSASPLDGWTWETLTFQVPSSVATSVKVGFYPTSDPSAGRYIDVDRVSLCQGILPHSASGMPVITAAGRALLDDVDTAAQRATLDVLKGTEPTTGSLVLGSTAGGTISGLYNVMMGDLAGSAALTGDANVGIGPGALKLLTSGVNNVGLGRLAGGKITIGQNNLSIGTYAGFSLVDGSDNIAIGWQALFTGDTAGQNVAIGGNSLLLVTSGKENVAIGFEAGGTLTTANYGVMVGRQAGLVGATQRVGFVALGWLAKVDGDYAVAIGRQTRAQAAGAVAIGTDSGGSGATTSTANEIMLGTSNHAVNIPGALKGLSGVQGDVLYHNGTSWVRLPAGTSGQFLKTQGAGANPQWAAAGGGSPQLPSLASNLLGYGVPGRSMPWNGTGTTYTLGFILMLPFVAAETESFDAYRLAMNGSNAGLVADLAIYSMPDWKVGSTATKVSGTNVSGLAADTSGTKTSVLGAPVALATGRYAVACLFRAGAGAANPWTLNPEQGWLGSDIGLGTTASSYAGWVQASGASSLAATYTIAVGATLTTWPVVLRRG